MEANYIFATAARMAILMIEIEMCAGGHYNSPVLACSARLLLRTKAYWIYMARFELSSLKLTSKRVDAHKL